MLASHPGVGFVVVATDHGPMALGAREPTTSTGDVVGEDPLALFGPDAVGDFIHVSAYANAPDIYVNSLYDPVLDEVVAFEELVGCHGGLGGWQTRPLLVHPAGWTIDEDLLDERGRLRARTRRTTSWCAGSSASVTAPTCSRVLLPRFPNPLPTADR